MRILRSCYFRLLACIGIVGIIVAAGIIEPRGYIGYGIFRSAYSLPPTRTAVLRFYTWSLKEFDGGYLPPRIDEYLIGRLPSCEGCKEETAIIDFQIRQHAARWNHAAFRSHESVQRQMISNLMGRLDTMEYRDAENAMFFIEALRRGSSLGKGDFTGMNPNSCGLAKERFRTWWGDGSMWPYIRSIDPLSGSNIAFHPGP